MHQTVNRAHLSGPGRNSSASGPPPLPLVRLPLVGQRSNPIPSNPLPHDVAAFVQEAEYVAQAVLDYAHTLASGGFAQVPAELVERLWVGICDHGRRFLDDDVEHIRAVETPCPGAYG